MVSGQASHVKATCPGPSTGSSLAQPGARNYNSRETGPLKSQKRQKHGWEECLLSPPTPNPHSPASPFPAFGPSPVCTHLFTYPPSFWLSKITLTLLAPPAGEQHLLTPALASGLAGPLAWNTLSDMVSILLSLRSLPNATFPVRLFPTP